MMLASAMVTGLAYAHGGPAAGGGAQKLKALVASDQLGDMLYYAPTIDVEPHIPRPADRRAMGLQFQWGAACAARALNVGGIYGREEAKDVALFVSSRAGERDEAVDAEALETIPLGEAAGPALNRHLMQKLRPTLFLSQIPNLLAGNLAILLGAKGPSRTFLGEEAGGAAAIEAACRAIAAGRSPRVLTGAALNAGRESLLRWHYAGGLGARAEATSPWNRPEDGSILGGAAAFLLVESSSEAVRRGARALAKITWLGSTRVDWNQHDAAHSALANWVADSRSRHKHLTILSNAATPARLTAEAGYWRLHENSDLDVINTTVLFGATLEADAPLSVSFAARWIASGDKSHIPAAARCSPTTPVSRSTGCLVLVGNSVDLFAILVEAA